AAHHEHPGGRGADVLGRQPSADDGVRPARRGPAPAVSGRQHAAVARARPLGRLRPRPTAVDPAVRVPAAAGVGSPGAAGTGTPGTASLVAPNVVGTESARLAGTESPRLPQAESSWVAQPSGLRLLRSRGRARGVVALLGPAF